MRQQIVMQQGDRGHDQRKTFPRVIIKNVVIVLLLELVAMILVRNAPGQSVFNPVGGVTGATSIGLSDLAICREFAAVPEVET